MTDADGNEITLNEAVWYDDGHSVDGNGVAIWVYGTVTGFPSTGGAKITPDSGGSVIIQPPKIHQNKHPNPPDR